MPGANNVQKKAGLFSLKMRLEDMLLGGGVVFFAAKYRSRFAPCPILNKYGF